MKLYVWAGPYHVPWGSSMLVVIATNLEEAKKLATTGKLYSYGEYDHSNTPEVELGEPTRVVELPCAEWYSFEE